MVGKRRIMLDCDCGERLNCTYSTDAASLEIFWEFIGKHSAVGANPGEHFTQVLGAREAYRPLNSVKSAA